MKEILKIFSVCAEFLFLKLISAIKNIKNSFLGGVRSVKAHIQYFFKISAPYFKAFKSKWLIIWGAVCVLLITASVILLNLTAHYYVVSYNGHDLGYSRNLNSVNATVAKLQAQFADDADIVKDLSLVTANEIQTSNLFLNCLNNKELQDIIINSSSTINYAYSVYINGERRFSSASEKTVNNAINDFKDDRITLTDEIIEDYDSCEVEWLNGVEITRECIAEKNITRKDIYQTLYKILEDSAEYRITCIQTENVPIPYMTSYTRNDFLYAGSKKVVQKGKNGIKAVNKKIVVENGEVILNKTLSEKVTKNAVTCKIQIGNDIAAAGGLDSHLSLLLPVEGSVSSGYGNRADPFTGEPANHNGLDISAKTGTPIIAAASGKVIQSSDKKNGFGNCVIIEHYSGFRTLYGHCSKLLVKEGEYVSAGDTIALVGSTGRSTGPHLHFSIIIDGSYVDPSLYF